jgi:glycosyltransferase involved in cell wall biosynthesis
VGAAAQILGELRVGKQGGDHLRQAIDKPDRETGLGVPMRDPVAIAAAIERLRADDSFRALLGAAARQHVEANHRWEEHLDRSEAMYDRVISAG